MAISVFSVNLKILRKRRSRSQGEVSQAIGIKRTTWSAYEQGVSEPSLEVLIKISDYFRVPVDILLREELSNYRESQLRNLEMAYEDKAMGRYLRVIVTSTDNQGRENVELIPENAKAGYVTGYADPDYIRVLPAFHLPFLSKERKYRTFPIKGDSMPPVVDGSYVTGEYVENWMHIKDGTPCILVTRDEGIVFKIVHNEIQNRGCLVLSSTNPLYEPYEVPVDSILELWRFVNYISPELPPANVTKDSMQDALMALQKEVYRLRRSIEKDNHVK